MEEAVSTGAETLVTSCPWCERVFSDAVEESGAGIEVRDLNEILLDSCAPGEGLVIE